MIKKILLPKVPQSIVDQVYLSIDHGRNQAFDNGNEKYKIEQYAWISANEQVQQWCKDNISPDIHWGIQVISDDLPIHKDLGTCIKFNYLIDAGGDTATTNFYDDQDLLLETLICELHTWYILDVTVKHDVKNVSTGRRISITGRILP